MPNNNVQPGELITLTAPGGGVVNGVAIRIGDLVVVPQVSAAAGVTFTAAITGVWTLAKATGTAWTEGLILYWANGTANFTTVATANQRAGVAAAAAASGDTAGKVRLDGVALGGAAP